MRQLIVNADDFGADAARNTGIIESIRAGAVTSISILPNGHAVLEALASIGNPASENISKGIHFNLSEGKPLTAGLKRLVGPDGCFLGKKAARLLLMHSSSGLEEEIGRELRAQIEFFQNSNIRIDHLDGHQHVHLLPASLKIVLKEMREHGIPWIRIPHEPQHYLETLRLSPAEIEEAQFFSAHAAAARPYATTAGLSCPDHFRGLYYKGRLPAENWSHLFDDIGDGLVEFMVHPGYASTEKGAFSGFSIPDREGELKALIDGRFLRAVSNSGMKLNPFPEAQIF